MKFSDQDKENASQDQPYRKYFGIPNRIADNPPQDGLFVLSDNENKIDYTNQLNRFKQEHILQKIRREFEEIFGKLIIKCDHHQKYSDLATICQQKYEDFRRILIHYEEKNHFHPYTHQIHKNSTNMKTNLLLLLQQAQNQSLYLREELQKYKEKINEILSAKRIGEQEKEKNRLNLQRISSLSLQNQQLKGENEEKDRFYSEKIEYLQGQLLKKNQELKKERQRKVSLAQELNELSGQVKTLTLLDDKKKSCIKLRSQKNLGRNFHQRSEDLQRFLLIQAIGIEELLQQ